MIIKILSEDLGLQDKVVLSVSVDKPVEDYIPFILRKLNLADASNLAVYKAEVTSSSSSSSCAQTSLYRRTTPYVMKSSFASQFIGVGTYVYVAFVTEEEKLRDIRREDALTEFRVRNFDYYNNKHGEETTKEEEDEDEETTKVKISYPLPDFQDVKDFELWNKFRNKLILLKIQHLSKKENLKKAFDSYVILRNTAQFFQIDY